MLHTSAEVIMAGKRFFLRSTNFDNLESIELSEGNSMLNCDTEFEDENDEEDDSEVKPSYISEAVVYSSDWTVDTILGQIQRGNINLNPRFQRRDAWSINKKSLFIESILLGLPVPQIVLALNIGTRGNYIVLDGKQRLLTLMQFAGAYEGKDNGFSLHGLKIRSDLNNKSYSEIKDNIDLKDDLDQFSNYTIRSVVIKNWPNFDFLHTVFIRLNSKSTQLSPQELRQALFPGEFVYYINRKAGESNGLKHILGIDEPDFRMRDVEILLRYLAFSCFIQVYQGNLKKFLDDTCDYMNSSWNEMQNELERRIQDFEEAVKAAEVIFGPENVGRKWMGDKFEGRFNRAVLDVIIFYFADNEIRSKALENRETVLDSFKALCTTNVAFRNSIESTTKSMVSTGNRFNIWGDELRKALRMEFHIPILIDNRIDFRMGFRG